MHTRKQQEQYMKQIHIRGNVHKQVPKNTVESGVLPVIQKSNAECRQKGSHNRKRPR